MVRCQGTRDFGKAHIQIRNTLKLCLANVCRTLKWTEGGVKYEAVETHGHALLRGFGLSEELKTVSSTAVKTEGIGSVEDED